MAITNKHVRVRRKLVVKQLPDEHIAIGAAGGDNGFLGVERDLVHRALMAGQLVQHPPRRHIPHVCTQVNPKQKEE
jgi:hypothetical protein